MSLRYLSKNDNWKKLEEAYIELRKKEGRFYTDEELIKLPIVLHGHPQLKEWRMRKHSLNRLIPYLKKRKFNSLLDLGCGNGWMSHQLSKNDFNVTAIDINDTELQQAARVFESSEIDWIYADIFEAQIDKMFDVIVISAALQYFKDPSKLLKRLFSLLHENGEVIIMDTFFYRPSEKDIARERSHTYYHSMDADFMMDHYHHHTLIELIPFSYLYVYKPKWSPLRKFNMASPFPIISLKK
jgi:ubiquinone/menaquinone biosynthesis C-methylase UbiE